MNEQAAFIRAICENPDDDTARLVYADWLQENGDEARAEFIRLQILLESTPFIRMGGWNSIWPEPWNSRLKRERELMEMHGKQWAGVVSEFHPGVPPLFFAGIELYLRGFIAKIIAEPARFLHLAFSLFSEQPITRVNLEKHPLRQEIMGGNWFWYRAEGNPLLGSAAHLPPVLFDRLPERARENGFRYSTDARDALSAVCVAYGRELVGLPPLSLTKAVSREVF